MGAWQDNSWTLSCRHLMVSVDFLKSFAWECSLTSKSTIFFSRHLVWSLVNLSLRASIATTSSSDFWLAFIFWYSTSNSTFPTCKWSRLAWMTNNQSWRVGSWTQYYLFLTKDLLNWLCILMKLDLVDSSA